MSTAVSPHGKSQLSVLSSTVQCCSPTYSYMQYKVPTPAALPVHPLHSSDSSKYNQHSLCVKIPQIARCVFYLR